MAKKITVEEVRKLAMKNYNRGGDGVIECWEDSDIQEAIDDGMITSAQWLKSFHGFDAVRRDIQNA